jgi:hypothetical protein
MSRAAKLAELRALRAAGKTRLSTYEVAEEEDLYDTVDDEGYKTTSLWTTMAKAMSTMAGKSGTMARAATNMLPQTAKKKMSGPGARPVRNYTSLILGLI